eukprot:scpid19977/ scgid1158/ Retrotransposable element Tf2 155 kDa protein type 1
MEVDDESKPLLTLNTHLGLFRLNRLPYGIASAPALWQRAIYSLLRDLPGVKCMIDDIIVTGRTPEEHLNTLMKVLQRLADAGLKLNLAKCHFFQPKVEYCGHAISAQGLHTMPSKVDAICDAPPPENVPQVRSFLGLITYYQRFIPKMSTILSPLTALLQKGAAFEWTDECRQAFQEVKQVLSSQQVLTHYDPTLPVRLASDASPYGVGAVLSHILPSGEERPIAYASRKLSKAEQAYSQIDREALAIVWSVKRFHNYLYGRHFELLTDHQPLVSIFHPRKGLPAMTVARLQRYAMFLAGHDYTIMYRQTDKHCNADGLSRLPVGNPPAPDTAEEAVNMFYMDQCEPLPVTAEQIKEATASDPLLREVHRYVQQGWPKSCPRAELQQYFQRRNELSVSNECLLWGNRVIIPPDHRKAVLTELHEGHPGMVRMKALARSILWWPGLDGDIADAVKACLGCQSVQSEPAAAPVHRWSMPDRAWQRVHVDYLGPLRQTMWLVIVDAHSKWPEVIPMPSTTSLATIASLRTVFARYGCPDLIVSDNGPQFASAEFAEFLASNGIAHRRSAPYHPATNGQAERFVQTFKRAIQAVPQSTPAQIAADRFLMSYRRGVHPATNATPAKLFLGRQLRSRLDLLRPSTAQQNAKTPTEEPAGKARSFEVGGAVLARDYRNANHPGWIPATILEKLGSRTYMIVTSQGAQWKRHLDQLRAGHPSFLVDEPTQSVAAPCLPPAQHPTAAEAPEPEPAAVPQQHEADATNDTTDASPTPTLRRSLRTRKQVSRLGL